MDDSAHAAPPLPPPPPGFDEAVDWLESWSLRLVLLEAYALDDLRAAVGAARSILAAHMQTEVPDPGPSAPRAQRELAARLRSDHAWFLGSIDQLGGLFAVVDAEDHGGHRQALGQYGRILAEAVRRHRRDERRFAAGGAPPPR
ncbi:MAG TPA: hypothetical protein VMG99_05695 [Thermoplasmata archaeon]|nr:hypothetical protein [Thermoplasmata archaeon]